MQISKAIIYSMIGLGVGSAMHANPVMDSLLNGSGNPPQNGKPKQSFKQNQRKELHKSRKKRNKQF